MPYEFIEKMSTSEEWNIPPIEKSLNFDTSDFPSFDRRYFKTYRTKKSDDEAAVGPQLVLVHSNRLCLVCLSPEHPVVKGGNAVKMVDFQVKNKLISAMTTIGIYKISTFDLRSTTTELWI